MTSPSPAFQAASPASWKRKGSPRQAIDDQVRSRSLHEHDPGPFFGQHRPAFGQEGQQRLLQLWLGQGLQLKGAEAPGERAPRVSDALAEVGEARQVHQERQDRSRGAPVAVAVGDRCLECVTQNREQSGKATQRRVLHLVDSNDDQAACSAARRATCSTRRSTSRCTRSPPRAGAR